MVNSKPVPAPVPAPPVPTPSQPSVAAAGRALATQDGRVVVDNFFSETGPLCSSGRQYRPGQHKLALTVAQCYAERRSGMLEGPTGSGKSFAYLASAILAGLRGQRTVIAVSTNNLLDQIVKDIPELCKMMGVVVSFAAMKGRSHYVCQNRASAAEAWMSGRPMPAKRRAPRLDAEENDQLGSLLEWVTLGGSDLTQYANTPKERVKRLVTITGEDCRAIRKNTGCEYDEQVDESGRITQPLRCHLIKARRQALRAAIVVTNIDVLMFNYRLDGGLLGHFDYVIADEAHELNAKVRDHFTIEKTMSSFDEAADRMLELIDRARPKPTEPAHAHSLRVSQGLGYAEKFRALAQKMTAGLLQFAASREPERFRGNELEVLLYQSGATKELLASCEELCDVADKAYVTAIGLGENQPAEDDDEPETPKSDVRDQAKALADTLRLEVSGNFAHSVLLKPYKDPDHETRIILRSVPIDVGGYLRSTLYEADEEASKADLPLSIPTLSSPTLPTVSMARKPVVIAISATLSPDGTWGFPKKQLAMPNDAITCSVDSPFDYRNSAIWYTPSAMPESWKRDDYNRAASAQAREIVRAVEGRTLILCSARADMEVARDAIKGLGFNVLMQGDAPPKQLGNIFREDKTSCMVGSRMFGTGFDVPGSALECVILWKMPFSKQSTVDELLQKRMGMHQWRSMIYVPAMLLDLRQWSGRLIRRSGDTGVIVTMDACAIDGKYRRQVTGSMPRDIRHVRSISDIEEFIRRPRA